MVNGHLILPFRFDGLTFDNERFRVFILESFVGSIDPGRMNNR